MTDSKKFDPKKLAKLNNPERLTDQPPEFMWKHFNLNNPQVLVDIGAGTGVFSREFGKKMSGGKVYACDISEIMINWMQENICKDYPYIVPVLMTENNVNLEDGLADLVFMINLHHELQNPLKLLKECHRMLKTGGKIGIIDWKKEKMEQGPPIEIRCKPEDITNQLSSSFFSDIEVFHDMAKHYLIVATKK